MSSRLIRGIVLAALALSLPVAASAQTARVAGLGVQGDYIKDYTGIFTYLSGVNHVGNLVYGELGNSDFPNDFDDRAVGAVIGNLWDGRFGVWSIHLREQTPQLGQGDASTSPSPGSDGSDLNAHTNQSFDLIWGKKFGGTSLGLRLNRSFYSLEGSLIGGTIEYDLPLGFDPNFSRNVLGLGAGIGWEMNPTTSIELAALFETRTFEESDGVDTYEDDGGASFQVAARMFWQSQPNLLVVPVFKLSSYDYSFTDTDINPGRSFEQSVMSWQVGLAGNWTLGSNDLFVLGATVAQNKVEADSVGFGENFEETEMLMPEVFAALETHVNSWLSIRFGARKGVFYTIKDEFTDVGTGTGEDVEEKSSPFVFSLGTGIKLGTLQIDATLDNDFVHNMPYLISGDSTGNMFPKVTATYTF